MVPVIISGAKVSWKKLSVRLHCFALVIMALHQAALGAGERSNIRGMGMAGTFVALSRGLDAVGINPANLALPDTGTLTISLLPLGVHAGSDFLSYDLYTEYFTGVQTDSGRFGRYLSSSDKQRLLDVFPGNVGRTAVEAEARVIGLSYRISSGAAVALTVTEQAGVFADIPRDYLAFILNGNPPGSKYDFSQTAFSASWTREYALSFGYTVSGVSFLESFSVGVAAKYVSGFGYYDVQRFNTSLNTAENGILNGSVGFLARKANVDDGQLEPLSLFPPSAGSGYGFDVGVAGSINSFLSFGMSVTDIGSVDWQTNVKEYSADTTLVLDDPLNADQRSQIEEAVKGKKREGSPFSASLPTTFRLGIAIAMHKVPALQSTIPGELLLELDYNQGFSNVPGTSTTPRVSLGVEFKPLHWLPLRTGVSFGGTDHVNMGLGLGFTFRYFDFEMGSDNMNWLFAPDNFSHASFAFGMRIRL